MKVYELQGGFGIDSLVLTERPPPQPAAGQVLLKMQAWSLNYRDLMVVKGIYQPNLRLPMTPFSDGVGEVVGLGEGVSRVKLGERVAGIFMPQWLDGEPTEAKARSALGGGAAGMAAERPAWRRSMWRSMRTASFRFRSISRMKKPRRCRAPR
jgi:NADPH:quinone reductase-like Zn-dependent oxidoreductase